MRDCELCQRNERIKNGEYQYLIGETPNSYWLLGEHQYYEGYTVILAKDHAREITHLNESELVYKDLLLAHKNIEKIYQPLKMNICSLGNVVPHVHWHLFPRYENDPYKNEPVWLKMNEFSKKTITPDQAQTIIKKIRGEAHGFSFR